MPRTPLIPGITDTDGNIRDIIDFYIRHDIDRAALLPNNPMWFDKLHAIGRENSFSESHQVNKLYDLKQKCRIETMFRDSGITIIGYEMLRNDEMRNGEMGLDQTNE